MQWQGHANSGSADMTNASAHIGTCRPNKRKEGRKEGALYCASSEVWVWMVRGR
jgi:hypothetical protein